MTLYYIAWFVLALIVVIAEMNLMSFYLLAVAIGATAGGISAYCEHSFQQQIMYAAIATLVASIGCYFLRKRFKQMSDKHSNQLDVGQRVVVKADNIKEDGTAQVSYRGAQWDAYKPLKKLRRLKTPQPTPLRLSRDQTKTINKTHN